MSFVPETKVISETRRVHDHGADVIHGTFSGPVTRQDLHARFQGSWGGVIILFRNGIFIYRAQHD